MKLLVDIGNTRIKWTLTAGEVVDDEVATCPASVAVDDLGRDVGQALERANGQIQSTWISSVGRSDFVDSLVVYANSRWRSGTHVVEVARSGFGVENDYDSTQQMGVDRWVTLVAARHHFAESAVVVIDAGTAITIDTLNREGRFIGGLIMPGAALARQALLSNTDRINDTTDAESTELSPFGKNTGECVYRGSIFAAIGGVRLALDSVTNALGDVPEVIVCGGDADTMASQLGTRVTRKPWLVLEGLALMAGAADSSD